MYYRFLGGGTLRSAHPAGEVVFQLVKMLAALLVVIASIMALALIVDIGPWTGVLVWLLLGTSVAGVLFMIDGFATLLGRSFEGARVVLHRFAMIVAGVMIAVVVLEAVMVAGQIIADRPTRFVLPEEWRERPVVVAGAFRAWLWHGELHLAWTEDWAFRRARPFPERTDGVARILVVGDSLTYGAGVAADQTYASRLENSLQGVLPVEVLNLGVRGAQSRDVLGVVQHWLPELEPDLVVYGVCLNDFLPSGSGEREQRPYAVPVPAALKDLIVGRTVTGRWLTKVYQEALITLGLRTSFFGEVCEHLDELAPRFAADLLAMNRVVTDRGLPPVVAMVLDQDPNLGGLGQLLAEQVEHSAAAADMTVIASEPYYREYDGQRFAVSHWERHPNSEAHGIFAEMMAPTVAAGLERP